MTCVAIDLGKTTCRIRAGGASGQELHGPGAPGLAASDGTTQATRAIVDSLHSLGSAPQDGWEVLVIGAAGALAAPEAAEACADHLLQETGARQVAITSDAVTAHLGAFGGATGVVMIAGTGAVAVGVDGRGEIAVGDGAGPEVGDRGSGAWLGRAALERAADGAASLAARAEQRYGADWRDLLAEDQGYELARRRGEFVADLAALSRLGDLTTVAVIREAAEELGHTARTTIERLQWPDDDVQVALLGGLTALGSPLREPFTAAVRPARMTRPAGSALDGADLLCERADLPHERLVLRRERT